MIMPMRSRFKICIFHLPLVLKKCLVFLSHSQQYLFQTSYMKKYLSHLNSALDY
jgi:hypothetical protein